MNKTSKITKVIFTTNWVNPKGGTIYYHEIEFANGDSGSVGRNRQNPEDMKVGMEIEYQINDKKIKFVKAIGDMNNNNDFSKKKFVSGGKKGPEEFLGYAYAYAKDMVVAGKTSPEDLNNLQMIAETIYSHIKSLLKDEKQQKEDYPF